MEAASKAEEPLTLLSALLGFNYVVVVHAVLVFPGIGGVSLPSTTHLPETLFVS